MDSVLVFTPTSVSGRKQANNLTFTPLLFSYTYLLSCFFRLQTSDGGVSLAVSLSSVLHNKVVTGAGSLCATVA